ncbi:DUF881 domain-containing protein [Romboutsia sp.]|uniref:DUF881 domain-containing protein n=1 Tax=Romboutsia sp. TaxID=1965302 RepID=UPI002B6C2363|nr:DUF881 domain-containing protein [Romboutsia sp.]HSQ88054.1 DUF881 domain-containing protein [Romboutsia sp.]
MHKKTAYKSLVICSIILGIFISLQLKTINIENNGMTTSKKGQQLAVELRRLKKEEKNLRLEIDTIKESIDEYKGTQGDNKLKSEIKKYEILAGYTNVQGPGIEVKIKQNKDINSDSNQSIIYNYDLLLSMINKLNSAQANAISINGERIVANTYIHLKEDNLFINDIKITQPILIKAIGKPETLASALQIKYGIVWEMEKYYNMDIQINKKENLKINRHSGVVSINDSDINKR